MSELRPFEVLGIDETDGSDTLLEDFDSSVEAIDWAKRYVSKENAGGWHCVIVVDARTYYSREESKETIYSWEDPNYYAED